MANIQAIEKAVMTTTDEKMLKQMAESMPYDIYQQLSPEARGRLSKVYGTERVVPGSEPISLPLRKTDTLNFALVKQLREIAIHHEKGTMMLPIEIVSIIEGRTQEQKFEKVGVAKVLRYVADMMEE